MNNVFFARDFFFGGVGLIVLLAIGGLIELLWPKAFRFNCWLFGCKVVMGYDGSEWCTRCAHDKPFWEGPIWGRKANSL